jgi:hypothetical protein
MRSAAANLRNLAGILSENGLPKEFIMAKWIGWWEQRQFGRQMMRNLVLEIDPGGFVVGGGDDCVGRFTFCGQFGPDGQVSLEKQYIGRHRVIYEGCNSGEGIFGTWRIPGGLFFYETGRFALRPLADNMAEYDQIEEPAAIG